MKNNKEVNKQVVKINEEIKQLEQRTGIAGTEYLQYKKKMKYDGEKMVEKIFYRQNWETPPNNKKWRETKFSTEEELLNEIGNKYKNKEEWDKIEAEKREKNKQNIPVIKQLEEIDKKIRLTEKSMKNERIDSLSEAERKRYFDLLKERRQIARKIVD